MDLSLFAHSRRDAWLVGIAALEITLTSYATLTFGSVPIVASIALASACVFLNCTNYQCVAHNFIHNRFFRSAKLNVAFSIFNTLALLVPQSLYRIHHLDHHKHNNDRPARPGGRALDRTSTYRYSRKHDREEHIVAYAFVGPFRTDLGFLYEGARRQDHARFVWVEVATLLLYMGMLTLGNWRGALLLFLPIWYLGQVVALAENYLEHHHAIPGNRLTDSVSSYGVIYNWLWFNNGYHQEHHYRPQLHWTRMKELRAEMLPDSQRRVVSGAHWFNFDPPWSRSRTNLPVNAESAAMDGAEAQGDADRTAPKPGKTALMSRRQDQKGIDVR